MNKRPHLILPIDKKEKLDLATKGMEAIYKAKERVTDTDNFIRARKKEHAKGQDYEKAERKVNAHISYLAQQFFNVIDASDFDEALIEKTQEDFNKQYLEYLQKLSNILIVNLYLQYFYKKINLLMQMRLEYKARNAAK